MITLEREGILINRIQRKVVQQHGGVEKEIATYIIIYMYM